MKYVCQKGSYYVIEYGDLSFSVASWWQKHYPFIPMYSSRSGFLNEPRYREHIILWLLFRIRWKWYRKEPIGLNLEN